MPTKRHKPEEIVAKLRQVDVLTSQGRSVADAIRSIGVTEVTYYRWSQEFGGLKSDQVRRLKDLEMENTRLVLAPAGAWPAELVGVAQPAMRRVPARTPPGRGLGSRSRRAAGRRCSAVASSR